MNDFVENFYNYCVLQFLARGKTVGGHAGLSPPAPHGTLKYKIIEYNTPTTYILNSISTEYYIKFYIFYNIINDGRTST